ncbi:TRAP transporter small permease [Salinicola sp. LHM]|uniref:TRAP transporter small permease n=1 Tax=Salinicola TaxID=404432 RepID=UPI000DA157E3|nr:MULTISPECIES: TRAP transporter small permease [Salinicola]MDF3920436.1 TRAP transporter small permease [Salinicola salarius]MEC8916772.1 TRAP transporter small permease [Pseudomonadota bacterium]MED5499378.1 TRAP transporter small permease [Pseudomonadota bacterium]WQH33885.1 TRAP transporter small permease [Salinicola sp. LHM]
MSEHETDIHQDIQENLEILTRVPRLGGPIGRLAGALDRVLLTLAVIALVGLSLTVLLQVASRLFLPITLSWTEELTRYLFIYMVAMGAGVVQHRHRHVNVELFHGWLGFRGRAAYLALISAITFAFTLMVLPNAWQFAQIGAFQTSPTLRIPMLYIFFSSVVLFGTLLLYSLIGLAEGIIAMVRGERVDTARQEAL